MAPGATSGLFGERTLMDAGYSISQSTLNSGGVALFGAALTFLAAWFWYWKTTSAKAAIDKANAAEKVATDKAAVIALDHARLVDTAKSLTNRLFEVEAQLKAAGATMTPIVAAFQAILVKQLTHADKPEMDALLVKTGPPDTLTLDERERLMIMLRQRVRDNSPDITESERDAARIFPIVMKMSAVEQENFGHAEETKNLKLVTVLSVAGPKTEEPAKDEGPATLSEGPPLTPPVDPGGR